MVPVLLILLAGSGCNRKTYDYTVELSNPLDVPRASESITLTKKDLGIRLCEVFRRVGVKDTETGEFVPVQMIDEDGNGELDYLVFQSSLEANETVKYHLFILDEPLDFSDIEFRTFSRFVPERTDDYAWENDRVAFRTYGPEARRMVEENIPGGTLSSGIDCWLKRVSYPVIDKWYRKHLEEGGSYHEDTGEGLDDFHVGTSRGCGGIGFWDEENGALYTSANFSAWKTLAVGPVRTLFQLEYDPWTGPWGEINETKKISLDLGSNLMRIEEYLESTGSLSGISAGLTLHEQDGRIRAEEQDGWYSYWQPHGDSELGMGMVVKPEFLAGSMDHRTPEADQSHLLVHLKPVNGKVVYYAGFGWKKNGRYTSEEEWVEYLVDFAARIRTPVNIKIKPARGSGL
jgi:hypothetical protein